MSSTEQQTLQSIADHLAQGDWSNAERVLREYAANTAWEEMIDSSSLGSPHVKAAIRQARECEAYARKGTGEGTCEEPLDDQGRCHRAYNHI